MFQINLCQIEIRSRLTLPCNVVFATSPGSWFFLSFLFTYLCSCPWLGLVYGGYAFGPWKLRPQLHCCWLFGSLHWLLSSKTPSNDLLTRLCSWLSRPLLGWHHLLLYSLISLLDRQCIPTYSMKGVHDTLRRSFWVIFTICRECTVPWIETFNQ